MNIEKYIKKPSQVEAVRFLYTSESINALKEWLGDKFIYCRKDRHPNSKGWIKIEPEEHTPSALYQYGTEGDYIVKKDDNTFIIMSPTDFDKQFEQI